MRKFSGWWPIIAFQPIFLFRSLLQLPFFLKTKYTEKLTHSHPIDRDIVSGDYQHGESPH